MTKTPVTQSIFKSISPRDEIVTCLHLFSSIVPHLPWRYIKTHVSILLTCILKRDRASLVVVILSWSLSGVRYRKSGRHLWSLKLYFCLRGFKEAGNWRLSRYEIWSRFPEIIVNTNYLYLLFFLFPSSPYAHSLRIFLCVCLTGDEQFLLIILEYRVTKVFIKWIIIAYIKKHVTKCCIFRS